MKVYSLDGNVSNFPPKGYIVPLDDIRPRSALHLECRERLRDIFSTLIILEEVPITPRNGLTLYLDFYVPQKKLIIECDGEQHNNYTPFFHGSKANFRKAQSNDRIKEEWAKLNNIRLIRINKIEDLNV